MTIIDLTVVVLKNVYRCAKLSECTKLIIIGANYYTIIASYNYCLGQKLHNIDYYQREYHDN